jgi:N-hydroxyarylamine O-acetyltransferase
MTRTDATTDDRDAFEAAPVDAYLRRLGIAPGRIDLPDRHLLRRLQRAHVTTVPFETLAVTGPPHGEEEGEGVVLTVPHLYEKIVERERGGYCFELNGLFHVLLDALGYDVRRVAARVYSAVQVPANHHVNVVELDRPYVVDVGIGPPMPRKPLPIDGESLTDGAGIAWRVVPSGRPDVDYRVESRPLSDTEWTSRYVFDDTPRPLHYFAATNDYLQSAPESSFTGNPTVARSTKTGYRKLSGGTLLEVSPSERHERAVPADEWNEILAQKFGLRYDPDSNVLHESPPDQ